MCTIRLYYVQVNRLLFRIINTSLNATQYGMVEIIIIISIISIQPEGRLWQEPEPSQATGMALAHCILGSFS